MVRRTWLISLFQALLVGAIVYLVVLNLMQLDPFSEDVCACVQCIAGGKKDPWFRQRYKTLVPKLMSRQNSKLSTNTSKWWQSLQIRHGDVNYSAVVKTLFSLFPDKEHYSDAGPHRCRMCAVVGNSGNLEGSHYGPLIDAHDFVIRINAGPTTGFEKDVGSKTTHRAIYPESAMDIDNSTHLILVPFKVLDLQWLISIFTTKHIKRTYKAVKSTVQANKDKVMILHPEFIRYIHENWLQKHGKYPSTGFIMLVFSLHVCDQVNVFGFGARKDGKWHHYFDKKYGVSYNGGPHSGNTEYNIILELEHKNKIQIYKGS
ncbi:CMP-N-acetylneuraminate-beta-galactosamide-alpha-2,3-sialyltransferase 1-like [Salminus brasiliensis]|uniref:CMP-N-acetylneuraminate-beta-galactosamide- alpha-2,3-sialyltransferase 1-like n=1 Tax=Salminus brasiliensis TaxID=930266 RepID=UPI003B837D6A